MGGRAGLRVGVVVVGGGGGDVGVAGGLSEGVGQPADMDWVGWRSLMLLLLCLLLLLTSLQAMLSNPVAILAVLTWCPE